MLHNVRFLRVLASVIATIAATMAPFWAHSASFDYNELFGGQAQRKPAPKLTIPKSDVPPGLILTLQAAQEAFVASEFGDAERLARRVTEAAPDAAEGWHLLGLALANLERFDESLDALAKAGSFYKNNPDPFTVSGDLLLHLGRRSEAKAAYEAAVERDRRDWRAVEALGKLAEQDGDTVLAKEYYKSALGVAPANRLYPWSRLAHLLINDGTPELAIPVLRNYVIANPKDARGYAALGHVQLANAAASAAEASFAKAYELAPQSAGLLFYLAQAQRTAGRIEKATATFEKARDTFPETAEVYEQLGSHYGALQKYEAAAETYEQALIRFPDRVSLLRGYRLANQRLGRNAEAVSAAEKLANRDDPAVGDVLSLAILAEKANNPELATSAYEKTIAMDPKNWVALNNFAALISESDPARAIEFASNAAKQVPGQTDVQDTLGWALFNSGDLTAARKIYDQIASGDGAKATYLYHLGRVMIEQGDVVDGKKKLQEALDLDPEFAYSADAEARLSN